VRCGANLPPPANTGAILMKQSDLPLVRPIGARLPPEAMRFIVKVAELFPGSERDIIIVRTKPASTNTAHVEDGQHISARGNQGK
jgi:hypothetical protein